MMSPPWAATSEAAIDRPSPTPPRARVRTGLVFSYVSGIIHPYYTIALAPAIGALTGIAAVTLWQIRDRLAAQLTMTAILAVTAAWAWVLLGRSPGWYPGLRVVVALGAAGLILSSRAVGGHRAGDRGFAGLTSVGRGRSFVTAAAVSLAVIAGLASPLAYSSSTATTAYTGAIPVAGPAVAGGGFGIRGAGGAGKGGAGGGQVPRWRWRVPGRRGRSARDRHRLRAGRRPAWRRPVLGQRGRPGLRRRR